MDQLENPITYIILTLGFLSLVRLAVFMISADIYDYRHLRRIAKHAKLAPYNPKISVIIPAYNEEICIIRTVESVLANTYSNKKLIVVDDGSKDSTLQKLQDFKAIHPDELVIVHQENLGKAHAINNALRHYAEGELVMVLDADSILHPEAIGRSVAHFRDESLVALAANVKVIGTGKVVNTAQRLEYIISHRLKRALTTLNIEYIIGGVGSVFRRKTVEECKYYDTDTLTEDIDFTMKIIAQKGNRAHKIAFASDVIAFTEGVPTFKGLLRQRFRWKYGRMQTFVKNWQVFFSPNMQKHNKRLTWLYLPYVVFSELVLLFDPLLTLFVLYVSYKYAGVDGVLSAYIAVSVFSVLNIVAEDTESWKNKLKLLLLAPVSYGLIFIMSIVDFLVLVKSLVKFPAILGGKNRVANWEHVERTGAKVSPIK